jgi:hypothetical protein
MPPAGPRGPYDPPPPAKNNMAALFSLICGLFQCIPFLMGLLAVILGFMGLKRARNPQVAGGGRGLAVVGIILGFLGLLGWTVFFAFGGLALWTAAKVTEKPRAVAHQVVQDLSNGNLNGAMTGCSSGMDKEDMAQLMRKMQPWGALKDMTTTGASIDNNGGVLKGTATFANATKSYEIHVNLENDDWKVMSLEFK